MCSHPFQFHFGTIKSDLEVYKEGDFTLFQFHFGTIKSGRQDARQYLDE